MISIEKYDGPPNRKSITIVDVRNRKNNALIANTIALFALAITHRVARLLVHGGRFFNKTLVQLVEDYLNVVIVTRKLFYACDDEE